LANARPEKIHKLWEGLGYYTRVRNMQKAAQLILGRHGGKFPEQFDEILALPGIGRYTAGAICSIAFNQPTPVLDGNVIRVLTRLFGIQGNPREKKTNELLWIMAQRLVSAAPGHGGSAGRIPKAAEGRRSPRRYRADGASLLNQSLMELGALICTPRQPKCEQCPVARPCVARRQNRAHVLPNLARRAPQVRRRFIAFVVESRGRYLVRRRPAGAVNASLWEFPNAEVDVDSPGVRAAAVAALGFAPRRLEPLCTIKHSITRYRIRLDAYAAGRNRGRNVAPDEGRWFNLSELTTLPFPSAHKKILTHLTAEARRRRV
jgi:A/G-specific adenine glycosylase